MIRVIFLFCPVFIIFAAPPQLREPISVTQHQLRYGEDQTSSDPATPYSNVYSSYSERLVFYYTNLYRINPTALKNEDQNPKYRSCGTWGDCYPPAPPLFFNLNLSRAARYHSNDMKTHGTCFEHTDCCAIDHSCPNGEEGSFPERIRKFYKGLSFGENIAAGHAYDIVVKNLINEVGASSGTDGHRHNILGYQFNQKQPNFLSKGTPIPYDELGVGNLEGGHYQRYVTQNFGVGSTRKEGFVSGIHIKQYPTYNTPTQFHTIFHQKSAQNQPKEVYLIINDTAFPMELTEKNPRSFKGSAINWFTGNYTTTISFPKTGCIPYNFQLIDGNGVWHKYPDQGQLLAGNLCGKKIYTKEASSINIKDINPNVCKQNICTEPFKTVCTIGINGTTCLCDPGYKLVGNECQQANSNGNAASHSDSNGFCSFDGERGSGLGVLLLLILLLAYQRSFKKGFTRQNN